MGGGAVEAFAKAGGDAGLVHVGQSAHRFFFVNGPFNFNQFPHHFGETVWHKCKQIVGVASGGGVAVVGIRYDAGRRVGIACGGFLRRSLTMVLFGRKRRQVVGLFNCFDR